jgi:polyhydroxybutyrate depolymerase
MNRRFALALAAALAASPAAAQTTTRSLQTVDGQRQVVVTDFSGGRPAPLVLVLHGALGTPEQVRSSMTWDAIARRERLVVAYPQGLGRRWNDGRGEEGTLMPGRSQADDMAFLRRVVEEEVSAGRADRRRVFAVGVSNGGFMTLRLLCEGQGLLAGAGVIIASLSVVQSRRCEAAPVPIAFVIGTEDGLIRYDGTIGRQRTAGIVLPPLDAFAFFARRNGCAGRAERLLPDAERDDNSRVFQVEGTGCRQPARFYRVEGGGHTVPTLAAADLQRVFRGPLTAALGARNRDMETAEEIWATLRGAAR